jgi:hypothetical protein
MYVYSFGAPGHGKGVYDGIGGTIKNKVHSLIKASKTSSEGVPGVEGGYITDDNDVFQAVKYHFKNGENRVRMRAGSNPISHYKFFSYLMADTPIRCPMVDEVFNSLEGISSNYQFVVHNCGLVYQ